MDAGSKRELEEKVYAGERLSRADGEALYASDDLVWLGRLAHHRRTALGGDRVWFTGDRQLTVTDACTGSCAYCSTEGYLARVAEVVDQARELAGEGITELHLANGRHSALPWRHYLTTVRELTAALPDVALTAFTASEVWWFEKNSGLSADEILAELVDAGLDALTGNGAGVEIFDPAVGQQHAGQQHAGQQHAGQQHAGQQHAGQQFVGQDCDWAEWSRIHRLAHAKGLGTPATMRYGHLDEPRHWIDHLLRLRELQDETGGFDVFVPLPYQHDVVKLPDGENGNRLPDRASQVSPADVLKTFAVSRLLFDNVPHLRCRWETYGLSVAQLSLNFGVDDLAGPIVEERDSPGVDGYAVPGSLDRAGVLDLIWDAGFRPVERDARYHVVREYAAPPTLAERRAEPQHIWA